MAIDRERIGEEAMRLMDSFPGEHYSDEAKILQLLFLALIEDPQAPPGEERRRWWLSNVTLGSAWDPVEPYEDTGAMLIRFGIDLILAHLEASGDPPEWLSTEGFAALKALETVFRDLPY